MAKNMPLVTLNLAKLKSATKPEFMLAACLAGTVIHESLTIDSNELKRLLAQFEIGPKPNLPKPAMRGLGDAVARLAQPIARAVDRVMMTKL